MQELAFVEFFSGDSQVWRAVHAEGVSSGRIDIEYMQTDENERNAMDILTSAGMALPSCMM